jgi:hypothetical protein
LIVLSTSSTYYGGAGGRPNGDGRREQLLAEAREKIQLAAAHKLIGAADRYGTADDLREAVDAYARLRTEHLERQALRARAALKSSSP